MTTNEPLAAYPRHYLLGIFDEPGAARTTATELRDQGVEDVQVLTGAAGADALDSDGSEHGLLATLKRTVEKVAAEIDHLREYEEAVRGGAAVVAIYAEDDEVRSRALPVMQQHDARFVNYFGAMAVELLLR